MLSRFFIDRPVFAWVIAIAMMLGGGLAIYNLPVSQYPPIAPPSISITAFYPGASAKTVEDSVVQIIEQKMTGLDKMLYMSATSDSSGSGAITLTFAPGTDPDLAWAKVQNKLQLALPVLPEVMDLIAQKCFPGGTKKNWLYFKQHLDFAEGISDEEQLLVCDAQTSGGMVISVPADRCDAMVASLKKHNALAAAVIGEVVADHPGRIAVAR